MSDTGRDDGQESAKKKRKKAPPKPLPVCFHGVTKADLSGFRMVKKPSTSKLNYGQIMTIAETFVYDTMSADGESQLEIIELDNLTLVQLIELCKKLGLSSLHHKSKFDLQGMIASIAEDNTKETTVILDKTKNLLHLSGYLCRFINCLFLNVNRDNWFALNDIKNRKDHEGLPGSTMLPKHFWPYIADAVGCGGEDVATIEFDCDIDDSDGNHSGGLNDMEIDMRRWWNPGNADPIALNHIKEEYEDNPGLLLCGIVPGYDATFLMLHHRELHCIRTKIIENMTESGMHTSNPHDFVEQAMRKVKNLLGFLEVYYFLCAARSFSHKLIIRSLRSYVMNFVEVVMIQAKSSMINQVPGQPKLIL